MRLSPRKRITSVKMNRSLLELLEASTLTSNELPALLESNITYQPLFARVACAKATCIDTNKWHLWTQKQAFRGVATQTSHSKRSTNVVPFTKRQRFDANNLFAQELLTKLDDYQATEKAPQLRFTPQPELVQRHTLVPGMSQQRKAEPPHTPSAPRPRGM